MTLAVFVNFSTGAMVPVVFHSDMWSTNAVIVFVVCLWYCYVVVDENSLGLSTCLTQCIFDLLCQMWELDEAMCRIDDHTVMSHKAQP